MSDDDPLAEFRKKPEPKRATGATGRLEPYEAYKSQDKVVALNIHLATGPSHSPAYSYLLDISYGRRYYTTFRLLFSFMVVKVTGENLKEVIDAIALRKCAQIQEFHPEDFAPPPAGAPIIRKIEYVVRTASSSSSSNDPDEEHE